MKEIESQQSSIDDIGENEIKSRRVECTLVAVTREEITAVLNEAHFNAGSFWI